jgi:hypothetical protein
MQQDTILLNESSLQGVFFLLFFFKITQLLMEGKNINFVHFPEGYAPLAEVTIQKEILAVSLGTIMGETGRLFLHTRIFLTTFYGKSRIRKTFSHILKYKKVKIKLSL